MYNKKCNDLSFLIYIQLHIIQRQRYRLFKMINIILFCKYILILNLMPGTEELDEATKEQKTWKVVEEHSAGELVNR